MLYRETIPSSCCILTEEPYWSQLQIIVTNRTCKIELISIIFISPLTIQLRSFHLHKQAFFTSGTRANGAEEGYPTYFYSPQNPTDHCVLKQLEEFKNTRVLLAVAIIVTQTVIPFAIPFCGRIFYHQIERRLARKQSNYKYYLQGFITTFGVLGVIALGINTDTLIKNFSTSGVSDVKAYYIIPIISFILNFISSLFNIAYNAYCFKKQYNDTKTVVLFSLSILILVLSTNILSFNFFYTFLGLIAAPIQSGTFLLVYLTGFFFVTMFFALIHKGWSIGNRLFRKKESNQEDTTTNFSKCGISGCDTFISFLITFFLMVSVIFYFAFYYLLAMAVQPYTSPSGFLSAFGSLVPAIFTLAFGLLERCIITFLDVNTVTSRSDIGESVPNVQEHGENQQAENGSIVLERDVNQQAENGSNAQNLDENQIEKNLSVPEDNEQDRLLNSRTTSYDATVT